VSDEYSEREKIALRYTDAIVWNPSDADDELWAQLIAEFTEVEIVELGYWIGFTSGGQRWLQTLNAKHGELAAAIAREQSEM
jgi:alkylhydroperoxidase family enzyme